MEHQHAAVWIDHRLARIVKFGFQGADSMVVRSKSSAPQLHHKANSIGDGRAAVDVDLYERVAQELKNVSSILIAGPSTAKAELAHHIRQQHPEWATNIRGVEPLDHPSERELLKFARSYLSAADRMR